MELMLFIFVSIGIIVIPGPNVLVIISTSISHGKVRGLQTVMGTSAAMAVQLLIAALSTAYFVTLIATGLVWLKWLGVAYLLYLGIKHLIQAFQSGHAPKRITATGSFQRGFWVSLTNPKTILFFGAFLPQFVSRDAAYLPQIVLLSVLFWILATVLDSLYALIASQIAVLIQSKNTHRFQNGFSGLMYSTAGFVLASTKNA